MTAWKIIAILQLVHITLLANLNWIFWFLNLAKDVCDVIRQYDYLKMRNAYKLGHTVHSTSWMTSWEQKPHSNLQKSNSRIDVCQRKKSVLHNNTTAYEWILRPCNVYPAPYWCTAHFMAANHNKSGIIFKDIEHTF